MLLPSDAFGPDAPEVMLTPTLTLTPTPTLTLTLTLTLTPTLP